MDKDNIKRALFFKDGKKISASNQIKLLYRKLEKFQNSFFTVNQYWNKESKNIFFYEGVDIEFSIKKYNIREDYESKEKFSVLLFLNNDKYLEISNIDKFSHAQEVQLMLAKLSGIENTKNLHLFHVLAENSIQEQEQELKSNKELNYINNNDDYFDFGAQEESESLYDILEEYDSMVSIKF